MRISDDTNTGKKSKTFAIKSPNIILLALLEIKS